ncbi:MAG TPA: extracellular solute-binding protein [Streptosporangiaceae bacterium]|nr:extracellular solute-binding protein [Streptosporangiaceae bacterium]
MSRAPRRSRRRRAVAGIAAVTTLGAVALAGCGGSSGGGGGGGNADSGTLKIITWVNPPAVAALTAINKEFEKKYPKIKVQLQTAVNVATGYANLLQTSVNSSSADIVTTVDQLQPLPLHPTRKSMTPTQFWSTNDVFADLSGQPWAKNLNDAAVKAETYNGKLVGLLSGVYQELVFYNKADFTKYGVTPPKTWDEFITLMNTLKSKGVANPLWLGLGGGASVYVTRFLAEPFMNSLWAPKASGETLAQALEKGDLKWDSPEMIQVLQREQQLAKYLEPSYTGAAWQDMPNAFAQDKAPMLLDGSWDLTSVQKANPSMDVGSFALPGSNDPSLNQPVANQDLTFEVLNKAPDKALAMKWMAFFASPAIYKQYVDMTGISPIMKSGGPYSSFSSKVLGPLFGQGFNPGDVLPALSADQGYWDTATQWPLLQESVMAGSKTPQQAVAMYQSDWKTG